MELGDAVVVLLDVVTSVSITRVRELARAMRMMTPHMNAVLLRLLLTNVEDMRFRGSGSWSNSSAITRTEVEVSRTVAADRQERTTELLKLYSFMVRKCVM